MWLWLASVALGLSAPADLRAEAMLSPLATTVSFAYARSHSALPNDLSALAWSNLSSADHPPPAWDDPVAAPMELSRKIQGVPRVLSRSQLCSTAASVAEANDLPVPFFTNLIQQESGFNSKVVSSAGAQGIAQFMPKTASAFGLSNPFDPVHALLVSGRFLTGLLHQFGNLGLAAAAYNAGPKRVEDWLAKRGRLPAETRNYVQSITGKPAEQWAAAPADPDHRMPLKTRCSEAVVAMAAFVAAHPHKPAPAVVVVAKLKNGGKDRGARRLAEAVAVSSTIIAEPSRLKGRPKLAAVRLAAVDTAPSKVARGLSPRVSAKKVDLVIMRPEPSARKPVVSKRMRVASAR